MCEELGAEVAALKFLKPSEQRYLEVSLRSFHRSAVQGQALWEVIPKRQTDEGTADMSTLLSLLYGLDPDPSLTVETESSAKSEFRVDSIADWNKIERETEVPVRAAALRLLIDVGSSDKSKTAGHSAGVALKADKGKSLGEAHFSAMVETFSRAALMDSAVLYCNAGASQLALTDTFRVTRILQKQVPSGLQLFGVPRGDSKYAIAPSDQLLAALQAQAVEAAVRLALKAPGTAKEKLKRVLAIPDAPRQSLHVAAERYAFQIWNEQGPCTKPSGDIEFAPVLLSAALAVWKGGHAVASSLQKRQVCRPMQNRSSIERAFILLRCTEETRSHFLELPGARRHARLVDYCAFLEKGMLCSAAWALEEYLESSPQVSYNFCVEVASYLAGPCAAALGGGGERAFVLTSLAWDWTANLSDGANLREPLSQILELLESRWMEVCNYQNHPSTCDFALPLHVLVEAQLRYSLCEVLNPTWREACEDVWETDGCLEAGGPVPSSGTSAHSAIDTWRAGNLRNRSKRRWAAIQIRRWWKKRLLTGLSIAPMTVWKVLQHTSEVLRGLSAVQPGQAARLVLLAKRVLESSAESGAASNSAIEALWNVGNVVAAEERELQRRQQGLLQQEEIERGRAAREQQRQAKRLRGLKKNRALERKAEALKMQRGR